MSKKSHGKRFKPSEKQTILDYLEDHTYIEACEKYGISETTLARWRKSIVSSSKAKNSKELKLVLPDFWLEYMEELVADGVGDTKEQVFINVLRAYARSQVAKKKSQDALPQFLENLPKILAGTLETSPEIKAFMVWHQGRIFYQTPQWNLTEGLDPLIASWSKIQGRAKGIPEDLKDVILQGNAFGTRDVSEKHIIMVTRGDPMVDGITEKQILIGLMRRFGDETVRILAFGNGHLDGLMEIVKKITSGTIPRSVELVQPTLPDMGKKGFHPFQKKKPSIEKISYLHRRLLDYEDVLEMLDHGLSTEQVCRELNTNERTVQRALKWREQGYPNREEIVEYRRKLGHRSKEYEENKPMSND